MTRDSRHAAVPRRPAKGPEGLSMAARYPGASERLLERLAICLESGVPESRAAGIARCEDRGEHCTCGLHVVTRRR